MTFMGLYILWEIVISIIIGRCKLLFRTSCFFTTGQPWRVDGFMVSCVVLSPCCASLQSILLLHLMVLHGVIAGYYCPKCELVPTKVTRNWHKAMMFWNVVRSFKSYQHAYELLYKLKITNGTYDGALPHCDLMTPSVRRLMDCHCYAEWLDSYLVPNHYSNQCRLRLYSKRDQRT